MISLLAQKRHSRRKCRARHLIQVFSAEPEARTLFPGPSEPLRVLAVAALFDAVSRSLFGVRQLAADELQGVLADLSMSVLR
ncbi:MAG: hypothetical protein ABIQ16_24035 [Polyangiaceae bacterium]